MVKKKDELALRIVKFIKKAGEPLETKEIEDHFKETRIKILYRLNVLRGDQKIRGKAVGSGKGAWIWWV